MIREKFGLLLRMIASTYTTKYIRVRSSHGTSVLSDGSVSIDGNHIFSSTISPISTLTVSVKNFTFTGMTGKSPCVYVNWCDNAGTVIGQRIPLAATAATGSTPVTASVTISNTGNASYFFLTFDENAAQGATTVESFATPLNATMESLTVVIN
jgi:hypothetical protein